MTVGATSRIPVALALVGVVLLGLATTAYPDEYRWGENTISALFQPQTPTGLTNQARPIAISGVLVAMAGVALLFHLISRRAAAPKVRRSIQAGGFGTTLFAALTVTPLHDLTSAMALLCFVVAVSGILHVLYRNREWGLVVFGMVSLGLELGTGGLYFGQVWLELLPIAQKAALLLIGLWLLAIQLSAPPPDGLRKTARGGAIS